MTMKVKALTLVYMTYASQWVACASLACTTASCKENVEAQGNEESALLQVKVGADSQSNMTTNEISGYVMVNGKRCDYDGCDMKCGCFGYPDGKVVGTAPLCNGQCSSDCPKEGHNPKDPDNSAKCSIIYNSYKMHWGYGNKCWSGQKICCCDPVDPSTLKPPPKDGELRTPMGGSKCDPLRKCSECEGDCKSDADCGSGLRCFHRSSSGLKVPGCIGGGSEDVGMYSYCYKPSQLNGWLQNLGKFGNTGCKKSNKCGICQGHCDSDEECASGLKCFNRYRFKHHVPGCQSGGDGDIEGFNYCFDPSQAPAPTPAPPAPPPCKDTDNGAVGKYGYHCSRFFKALCGDGFADNDVFKEDMCCVCGGGTWKP